MAKTKILYVEDEQFLGKIVRESLESRGFTVIMETDGDKVLPLFRETRPDICVLDVMLPGKDGFTIAKEIRQENPLVPLLFLTAKTQTEDLVKGFSLGGNDYIRKPFSMEELIVRINNALRHPAQATTDHHDEVLSLGTYTFFTRRQVLQYAQEEKKLSFRESELLKLLYAGRDRIIDRKEMLNQLWGSDSFFNSRNLDVYITRLRSYLKNDPALEIITIKGVGYRFVTG
jgi:DNA-binding response OmpR family regulator